MFTGVVARTLPRTALMTRFSSLRALYVTRLREFYHQPARIFWVYGFPTVLAICLGLAFQSRPPDNIQVDLVRNAALPPIEKVLTDYDARARKEGGAGLLLRVGSLDEALHRLNTGKTPLVVIPDV